MSEHCESCIDDVSDAPLVDGAVIECIPFYVGGPTPSKDVFPSRFDLASKLTRKGMLGLAAGTLVGLVALPKAVKAVQCNCGTTYNTGTRACEYAWYAAVGEYRRTGRRRILYSSHYDNGTAGGCGAYCEYWSGWFCDRYTCPPGMPGYC